MKVNATLTTFTILELRTGLAKPFGPKGEPSAINKQLVERSSISRCRFT